MDSIQGLYVVKSRSSFFLVKIKEEFSEGEYSVKVVPVPPRDGEEAIDENSCITIDINLSFGEHSAEIDYISFNKSCSLFEPMQRGKGTRDMVKSTLSLCRKIFGVSKYTIHDASSFTCGPDDANVDLWFHNTLVYGQTWYERNFGALPSSPNPRWEGLKSLLAQKVDRERADRVNLFINYVYHDDTRDTFVEIVEDSVDQYSWNTMFTNINLTLDGCEFFTGPMMDYLAQLFDIHMVDSWFIPISDDDMSEYLIAHEKIRVD